MARIPGFFLLPTLTLLLGFSASTAVRAADERIELPFSMETDSLCFRNGDPDLANVGVPFLGRLGVKKGVCQGIAGIAAAFREKVDFSPSSTAVSPSETVRRIERAIRLYRNGSRERVEIPGFSNLHDLCVANRKTFLREAIWLNLDIAVSDILPLIRQFERVEADPIRSQRDPEALRRELDETVSRIRNALRDGHYPLVLIYSHVVMVRGYREIPKAGGAREVSLEVYDSNDPNEFRYLSIPYSSDGLPSVEGRMRWILSP